MHLFSPSEINQAQLMDKYYDYNDNEWAQRGHGDPSDTWTMVCWVGNPAGRRLAVRDANTPGFHADVWNEHGNDGQWGKGGGKEGMWSKVFLVNYIVEWQRTQNGRRMSRFVDITEQWVLGWGSKYMVKFMLKMGSVLGELSTMQVSHAGVKRHIRKKCIHGMKS